MKISEVSVFPVKVPLEQPKRFALRTVKDREYVIVKIMTEDGVSGWGYSWGPQVLAKIISDHLQDLIIDENPLLISFLWEKMYKSTLVWGRRGLVIRALSAIDIALWDLAGNILNVPIYKLLGGFRYKVPAYYSGGYYLEHFRNESQYLNYIEKEFGKFRDKGFRAFKMKIGAAPVNIDMKRVELAREVIGDDALLMIDANNAWRLDQAVRMSKLLEPYKIEWLEEPLMPDDIEGHAILRQKTNIPIALGENHYTRWEFKYFLDYDAVDIIQGDPLIMGGITEFQKLQGLVSSSPVYLAPHNSHNINVQVGAGLSDVVILEYFALESDIFNFDKLLENPVQHAGGYLEPYDSPGHGLILDTKALNYFYNP